MPEYSPHMLIVCCGVPDDSAGHCSDWPRAGSVLGSSSAPTLMLSIRYVAAGQPSVGVQLLRWVNSNAGR